MPKRSFKTPFNGEQRKEDGVTITFREKGGELRTRARNGLPMKEAVHSLCADADLWEGEWKVQCVSTPTTIWRDLQGIREYYAPAKVNDVETAESPAKPTTTPEAVMLSNAGCMDMFVAPRRNQEYRNHTYPVPGFATGLTR